MKIKADVVAVTDQSLNVGLRVDFGGALRFTKVSIPLSMLVDTPLVARLDKLAQQRADAEYQVWLEQQEKLFEA